MAQIVPRVSLADAEGSVTKRLRSPPDGIDPSEQKSRTSWSRKSLDATRLAPSPRSICNGLKKAA